jgi:protein kinase A
VQSKHNQRFYAVKVLKKAQVVKMKQVEHTNDERRMLQQVKHPFLITLWGTFQDSKNLYMVMDFVEGGELFSLLRKSQVGKPFQSCTRPELVLTRRSVFRIRSQSSMRPK